MLQNGPWLSANIDGKLAKLHISRPPGRPLVQSIRIGSESGHTSSQVARDTIYISGSCPSLSKDLWTQLCPTILLETASVSRNSCGQVYAPHFHPFSITKHFHFLFSIDHLKPFPIHNNGVRFRAILAHFPINFYLNPLKYIFYTRETFSTFLLSSHVIYFNAVPFHDEF